MNKKQYDKKYYKKHKEKILEYNKKYQRKWRKNNPEKLKEINERWKKNNPEYKKKYRQKNKEKIKKIEKQRRIKKKEYVQDYKLSKGCSVCGYNKCASALDFHHENGDKEYNISKDFSKSLERIKKEMDKCIILCANCHRELHKEEVKTNVEKN